MKKEYNLSKDTRLVHYEVAYNKLKHKKYGGFCGLLPNPLTEKNYPELMKFKPFYVEIRGVFRNSEALYHNKWARKYPTGYWFNPKRKLLRKLILKWIIMQLYFSLEEF